MSARESPPLTSLLRESLCHILTESLLDPTKPKHCAHFYISCILLLKPHLSTLRRTNPSLITTILRLLTYPRTEEDLESLDVTISECHCPLDDPTIRTLHTLNGSEAPRKSLLELFELICNILTSCFHDESTAAQFPVPLDTTRKRAKKAQKEGRRAAWPEQPSDVFVYPPGQMLATLWTLFRLSDSPVILFFLHCITSAAGSTFTSLFYTLPSFPVEYMIHLERALSSPSARYPKFLSLTVLTQFLSMIWTRMGHDVVKFVLWHPHVHSMLTFLSRVIAAFSSLPTEECKTMVEKTSILGGEFVIMFRETDVLDLSLYAPQIRQFLEKNAPGNHEPLALAWLTACSFARSDECQAPECVETYSKQNRKFSVCGACGIMSYCSKACQQAAWKHKGAPHKLLCGALKAYTQKFSKRNVNWAKSNVADCQEIVTLAEEVGATRDEAKAVIRQALMFYYVSYGHKLNEFPGGDLKTVSEKFDIATAAY